MIKPRVTIVVAIYNVKNEYLIQCIESLRNQTLNDIEILLISDNSCQKNIELMQYYEKKDKRIRCIYNTYNRKLAGVRNQGIEEAKGEFICYVDNDDWMDREACKKAYYYAIKTQAEVVLWSYQTSREGENKKTNYFGPSNKLYVSGEELDALQGQILDPTFCTWQQIPMAVTAWAKLYSVEYLRKHKEIRFPENLGTGGEDYVFNYQLMGEIKRAFFFEDYSYYYRQFSDSFTKQYRGDEWCNRMKYIREIGKFVKNEKTQQRHVYERFCLNEMLRQLCVTQRHPDCCLKYKQKKDEVKKIVKEDIIQQALNEIRYLSFNCSKRLYFMCAKRGWINILLLMSAVYSKKLNVNRT